MQSLQSAGFDVLACENAEEVRPWIGSNSVQVVVADACLPGNSGLELPRTIASIDASLPVIVTGDGGIKMAVEAMRRGAYDFIESPFAAAALIAAIRRAQKKRDLSVFKSADSLSNGLGLDTPPLIGRSVGVQYVRDQISTLGPTMVDVLINGDTGTGKEVVARQLHFVSGRKGPFVAINCAALPETLFDNELFGHEAGAYTGAHKRHIGKLEYASGGTLFLDEIESMPLALQVKLLRVLQDRRIERLGGNQSIEIDCRVIAASKEDLLKLGAEGRFRTDLFYRISVVNIDLPPLAERTDDIPILLEHFVKEACARFGRMPPSWSDSQTQEWQARPWPGNVRELRNFADRLVLGVRENKVDIGAQVKGPDSNSTPQIGSLLCRVGAYERKLISHALNKYQGNVASAAAFLQISKKTLYEKLKKLELSAGGSPRAG
jgi:two-component system C4-dicarboxylate transport response regulator DctD